MGKQKNKINYSKFEFSSFANKRKKFNLIFVAVYISIKTLGPF